MIKNKSDCVYTEPNAPQASGVYDEAQLINDERKGPQKQLLKRIDIIALAEAARTVAVAGEGMDDCGYVIDTDYPPIPITGSDSWTLQTKSLIDPADTRTLARMENSRRADFSYAAIYSNILNMWCFTPRVSDTSKGGFLNGDNVSAFTGIAVSSTALWGGDVGAAAKECLGHRISDIPAKANKEAFAVINDIVPGDWLSGDSCRPLLKVKLLEDMLTDIKAFNLFAVDVRSDSHNVVFGGYKGNSHLEKSDYDDPPASPQYNREPQSGNYYHYYGLTSQEDLSWYGYSDDPMTLTPTGEMRDNDVDTFTDASDKLIYVYIDDSLSSGNGKCIEPKYAFLKVRYYISSGSWRVRLFNDAYNYDTSQGVSITFTFNTPNGSDTYTLPPNSSKTFSGTLGVSSSGYITCRVRLRRKDTPINGLTAWEVLPANEGDNPVIDQIVAFVRAFSECSLPNVVTNPQDDVGVYLHAGRIQSLPSGVKVAGGCSAHANYDGPEIGIEFNQAQLFSVFSVKPKALEAPPPNS